MYRQRNLIRGSRRSVRIVGDGHLESHHQITLVSWARTTARLQKDETKRLALEWFHSIPNGVFLKDLGDEDLTTDFRLTPAPKKKRAPYQALRMIAEGLTRGIWDLRLDYVLRDESGLIVCPGLIVEMKRGKRKLTDEQRDYRDFMIAQGFRELVAYNWQEGARGLIQYMSLEQHAPIWD